MPCAPLTRGLGPLGRAARERREMARRGSRPRCAGHGCTHRRSQLPSRPEAPAASALPPAVVFLVPDGIAPTLDSLHPGSHYLRRNESLARDLPIVVTRALESAARADLEQKLTRATSAREDAEQRQQAAADQLTALQTQYRSRHGPRGCHVGHGGRTAPHRGPRSGERAPTRGVSGRRCRTAVAA